MTDQQLAAELFSFTFAIVYADCVVTSGVGEALAGSCVAAGVGLADSCTAAGVGLIVGAAPRTTSPCTSRSPTATVMAALARDVITKE